MSAGEYSLGLCLALLVAVALGRSAHNLRRLLLPAWHGPPALLAEVVLAVALLLVILQALGVTGLLDAPALLLTSIGTAGVVEVFWRRLRAHPEDAPALERPTRSMGRWSIAIALAVAIWIAADWFVLSTPSLEHGVSGGDSIWYHLPFSTRFAQEGSITGLHYTSPRFLSWLYPANSELLGSAWEVVSNGDLLMPVLNLLWLALAMLAAWCIGRPFGVAPLTLVAVALLLDSTALTATQPGSADNDIVIVALVLAAAGIVLNDWGPTEITNPKKHLSIGAVLIAGAAAGIAIGTKLMMVVPMLCLAAGLVALSAPGRRFRAALILAPTLAVTSGFWYARNLVVTGNPLPWREFSFGPISLPSPDVTLGGAKATAASVASYWNDPDVWVDWFAPGLAERFGSLWPLVIGGVALGAILALFGGPTRAQRILGAVAVVAAVTYVLMPLTAEGLPGKPVNFDGNLRQASAAIALGLAMLPTAWRVAPLIAARHATVCCGLAALALLITDEPLGLSEESVVAVFVAGTLMALLAMGLRALVGRVPSRAALAMLGAGITVVVVAGGVVAASSQRYVTEFDTRLEAVGIDEAFRWAHGVRGARIGTTSILQYGLYGPELDNWVEFVGSPGPDGAFTEIQTCESWRRRVNERDYDYVVVAPRYTSPPALVPLAWTRSAVTTPVAARKEVTVFRIDGELDPNEC